MCRPDEEWNGHCLITDPFQQWGPLDRGATKPGLIAEMAGPVHSARALCWSKCIVHIVYFLFSANIDSGQLRRALLLQKELPKR